MSLLRKVIPEKVRIPAYIVVIATFVTIVDFFMHRKVARPYHIDYAFASADLFQSSEISIGRADEWLAFSDHMPLVLDIACV